MSEHMVEPVVPRRLDRSRSDRMLAGVCGGLARYFDIHPAFYRVGFVVLTLVGGAGVLVYLAAALVIPDEGEEESIAASVLRERRHRPWPLVGLALLAVAGAVLLSRVTFWPRGDVAWILILIVGGLILLLTRHRPAASETSPAPPADAAGTQVLPRQHSHWLRGVAAGIAITLGVLVALVFVAATIFAAVLPVHLTRGIGDHNYRVYDVRDLRSSYKLGIGDLNVDLSRLRLPVGETHVKAEVDIGRVTVIVPRNVALQVRGEAEFGEVNLLGETSDGRDTDQAIIERGERVLVLDGHVGAGKLVVDRAVR